MYEMWGGRRRVGERSKVPERMGLAFVDSYIAPRRMTALVSPA